MENINDNQESLKNELSAENKKWLEQLLNTSASAKDTAKQASPAAQPESKPENTLSDRDAELEKILAEDWSGVTEAKFPEAPQPSTRPEEPEALNVPDTPAPEMPVAADDTTPTSYSDMILPDEPERPRAKRVRKPDEQKLRPKNKGGYGLLGIPHVLSTAIWLILILAIGISLGRVLWVCCADVMAFGKEPQKVTITITEDDNIKTISQKLGHANLVRYPGLFEFFATVTGKDDDISIGTFTLNAQLDYNAMINAMASYRSNREIVDIMFPEGYNCAQIFKLLEDKKVCTVAELEEYAANGELKDYWFLEGVSRGDKYCLEGYMAPDTYKFYTDDEPRRVIEKFLNEFDDRFTDIMKKDFETMKTRYADMLKAKGYSSSYIKEHTLTLHQVVTLASVVQKEAASNAEGYDIASVFYNRLANPDIQSLGADATVYYALGDYFGEIEELTAEHLKVDSPYNTRLYKGIPPGPICNMGVQALYAALEPNETKYNYFVYDPSKSAHRFAVTYSEHWQNILEVEGQ